MLEIVVIPLQRIPVTSECKIDVIRSNLEYTLQIADYTTVQYFNNFGSNFKFGSEFVGDFSIFRFLTKVTVTVQAVYGSSSFPFMHDRWDAL